MNKVILRFHSDLFRRKSNSRRIVIVSKTNSHYPHKKKDKDNAISKTGDP